MLWFPIPLVFLMYSNMYLQICIFIAKIVLEVSDHLFVQPNFRLHQTKYKLLNVLYLLYVKIILILIKLFFLYVSLEKLQKHLLILGKYSFA